MMKTTESFPPPFGKALVFGTLLWAMILIPCYYFPLFRRVLLLLIIVSAVLLGVVWLKRKIQHFLDHYDD